MKMSKIEIFTIFLFFLNKTFIVQNLVAKKITLTDFFFKKKLERNNNKMINRYNHKKYHSMLITTQTEMLF